MIKKLHHRTLTAAAALTLVSLGTTYEARAASVRDLDRDGIPNNVDPDIDNDGLPNGIDPNVDGGLCRSGRLRGRYIGDRINNGDAAELDIDDDGLPDDSDAELDIDGDRRADDSILETDIDGDGRLDDSPSELDIDGDGRSDDSDAELDIDGDGRLDDSPSELDIDGDGRSDDSAEELDIDGDGRRDDSVLEVDTDGDGRHDGLDDDDDDGDGTSDDLDEDDDGDGHKSRNHGGDDDDEGDDNTGGLPGGIVGDGNAPAALVGLTYLVSENGTEAPERVEFLTATTGRKVEGADIDPFSFTYTPNGTTATFRLQFKTDKWDDYTVNFATGTFSRVEFDKNVQKDSDTGTFALPQ
jgi:hypothetical protein